MNHRPRSLLCRRSLPRRGLFVSYGQEAGVGENERTKGSRSKASRVFSLPIVPCALATFRLLLFLLEYLTGASSGERAVIVEADLSSCRAQLFEGRLALNPGFFFLCSNSFSRIIFPAVFRSSNHQLVDNLKELKLKCFLSFQI